MGFFDRLFKKGKKAKSYESKDDSFVAAAERVFDKKRQSAQKGDSISFSSGDVITEMTGGENLVNGSPTYAHAEQNKHDIEIMKKCCEAELRTMELAEQVPAPYYFERVAILSRKEKNYHQEIEFCEKYISAVNGFFKKHDAAMYADVRKGPRYKAIVKRLPKAKALLLKLQSSK